ncbi:MAG: argininosuccinate synthase [Deferribacteres bacterium]|nr:argininosuccinate synthase [candidate division KSB1 bacterium]MCB9503525.1 argininosuccinate synthase [Deferribacteres bacterium]
MKPKKVVLAYSGGLDTSIIIPWLKENYGCEVIAMAADLGQGAELEGLEEKALKTGASKLYIEDLRTEFVEDFLFPMIKSGAIYEGKYLLGTSIARPLIARRQVEIAEKEGADALAHGCTGKGNDQVRFELTYKAFNPKLKVIAPWREWDIRSREDAIAYADERSIPITASREKIYSHDDNLWHRSSEGGALENPWNSAPEEIYHLTVSPEEAPDKATVITVEFVQGIPVGINGQKVDSVELVSRLNKLGGENGIGRIDIVENRLVGMKSRGVYETPGGTILYAAHRELESLVLSADILRYKDELAPKYASLIYNGQWFTPLREAMEAFIQKTQEQITGTVRLKLYKGNCIIEGRKSPYSLYREDLATFGKDDIYDQKDAAGFINLFGLPLKVKAMIDLEGNIPPHYDHPDYSIFKRD